MHMTMTVMKVMIPPIIPVLSPLVPCAAKGPIKPNAALATRAEAHAALRVARGSRKSALLYFPCQGHRPSGTCSGKPLASRGAPFSGACTRSAVPVAALARQAEAALSPMALGPMRPCALQACEVCPPRLLRGCTTVGPKARAHRCNQEVVG